MYQISIFNLKTTSVSIYFNKKRTLRQYLGLIKYFVKRFFVSIPYRLTARKRTLPDFLIIGAMKGGTSSLYHWINLHPDAKLSREQEVHYFANTFKKGINYYRSYFPKSSENKKTGESSPYYLYHPLVPARVRKELPNCKVIILLRDPVYRAYSHYQMHKGIDPANDFNQAIEWEQNRVAQPHQDFIAGKDYRSTNHQAYSYIGRGMYFEQLSRWYGHFPEKQILVIKSEEMYQNPAEQLQKVFDFLALAPFEIDNLKPVNQRQYKSLEEKDYTKYRNYFEEDSKKLIDLLGPKFTWNYPQL